MINFPTNTRDIINTIRSGIGREVDFVYGAGTVACSACSLDPVTDLSTNPYCFVCSGQYWIPVVSSYVTKAHILWGNSDQLNWQTGGKLFDGDCRIQVEYTDTLITVLDSVDHVTVDGKILDVKKVTPRGVPELNRMLIDLEER